MHAIAPVLDSPELYRYGYPTLEKGASPAAGADFVRTLDEGFAARLLSVHVRLVASADVASREVVVEYRDEADNRFALAGINTTVTAGLTADYVFSAFQPEAIATVDGSALVPLPPLLLMPAWDFRIHVVSASATDQLSRIRYVWERFYVGRPPGGIVG